MKLLLYSYFFAPSIGGVETIVRSLAVGLSNLRTPDGGQEFAVTLITQTPVSSFDDKTLGFRVVRQPSFSTLRSLIAETDLVHVAGPAILPMILARLAGKRLVVEHHGFQTICPNGQLLIEPSDEPCPGHFMAGRHGKCLKCDSRYRRFVPLRSWLLTFVRRRLCSKAAINITPTRWLGDLVQLPSVKTIPHGLAPRISSNGPSSTSGPPRIVYQGRLVTTKGLLVLLNAAVRLARKGQPYELLIIGDGPERPSLEYLARKAKLEHQIKFCGWLATHELESVLSRALVVVVPSLGGEVFGLVVAESMQRGLPVIASDLGAFTEVIGDAGIVFRTGNAPELADRLESILNDPALRENLGRRAAERIAQRFSESAMIEGHVSLYRQVLR